MCAGVRTFSQWICIDGFRFQIPWMRWYTLTHWHTKIVTDALILVRQRFAYTRIPILAEPIRPTQCDLSIANAPFGRVIETTVTFHVWPSDSFMWQSLPKFCFFSFITSESSYRKKKRNFIFGNRRQSEIKLSLKINTIHRSFHHKHIYTDLWHTCIDAHGSATDRGREREISMRNDMSLWASHF